MCGIAGVIQDGVSKENWEQTLRAMTDSIIHRGPDDDGVWCDPQRGIGFGHRRLAILDLSPSGHQPMRSACGRYVTVFNGEIYNFRQLRGELEQRGYAFRGHSDTEVMLACISEWGLESALSKFVGMFAIALWDKKNDSLSLVCDRLGKKPLYYGWVGRTFLFGSELKAIRAHSAFKANLNRDALALLMRHDYIPAPSCIYEGFFKLRPGFLVTVFPANILEHPEPVPYWSSKDVAETCLNNQLILSESEATAELHRLLLDAVKLRMESDVPLGAFLSGGIDSSTIVALMQAQSDRPVKTFSIGFHEAFYNEAQHAQAVAKHLGTDHTELYVTSEEAMDVIPHLPILYDEPFADSSQIPVYLVSKLARQHVTVSLSGDGGDELFGGYTRYFLAQKIWDKISWLPQKVRSLTGKGLIAIPHQWWTFLFHVLGPVLPKMIHEQNPVHKLNKLAHILGLNDPEEMYRNVVSLWNEPTTVVIGSHEPQTILTDRSQWAQFETFMERMMYLDAVTYLPGDLLVKVDRASMGVSLESRVPLLDHRVVEFAWRLPLSTKVKNGQGKWILRQVLNQYVPTSLIDRPKMGFGVPLDGWLRGPLKEWAEGLIQESRLKREGYLNPGPIREKWSEHLSGEKNWQYLIWNVLMFQAWLEKEQA